MPHQRFPSWSPEQALAAGAAFAERVGRLPISIDLHPPLPSYQTIKTLFGCLAGYHIALGAPPPTAEGLLQVNTGRQTRGCLRCDASFLSAHLGNRICPACKRDKEYQAHMGQWMVGEVLRGWD